MSAGRNDPCHCGSGKKAKKCCQAPSGTSPAPSQAPSPTDLNHLIALFNAGHYAELERRARLLLGRYPHAGFVWKILGVALQVQGRDSLPALKKAAEFLPGDAEAHYNFGNALLMLGRLAEAEAAYREALCIRPGDADAHYNLGNTLLAMGRPGEAEASYRQALRIRPDYAEVHSNLGNVLAKLGRPDEAEASYRQALKIKPGYAVAYFNLGNFFHERGRLEEAEADYRRALEIKPDSADTHVNLGKALHDMGRPEEAEASYREALRIAPGHTEAHTNLGETLLELGRQEEAEASLRRALEARPDHVRVRLSLAQARKAEAGDENLAALLALEQAARDGATPLPTEEEICLHFALGKSYDDLGDHGQAFAHFLEGNRLKRATLDFDPERAAQRFAAIMQSFDTAALDGLRGGGDPSHLPVFILGMPRSGTTLAEQIVSSHPGVHGAGELPDLGAIMRRDIAGAAFPGNLRALDRAQLAAWGAEYAAGLQRRAPSAARVTDKMPVNFLAVGLIHLMLPNAKIIHVTRSPADTCLSCFTQLFREGQEFSYDLAELGRYYAGYASLMEHWRKVLPEGAFLDVRYEDLVADQEAQSRRIVEYCGLEWDDACLDFHRNRRPVKTASMAQVRRPMYRSSLERWRNYESFLKPLFDALEGS